MFFRHALGALVLLVSTICAAGPVAAADEFKGTWSIIQSDKPGMVRFGLHHRMRGGNHHHESDWPVSAFSGLEPLSAGRRDVTFHIDREAGRFDCEGTLRNGEGTGIFRFTPDARYVKTMESLGFDVSDESMQFGMAVHDVTSEYARAMKAEKLKDLDTDKLLAFRIFDVTAQFIRELRAEGLAANEADKLIAFRVHGVTAEMVKEVREAGLDVSEEMLIAFRVHGVSPEYIAKIEKLGFARPEANQLVAMRVHGVTPEFIAEMRSRGLKDLSIDQLINLRVHGIH
jgi:hypothetical protein